MAGIEVEGVSVLACCCASLLLLVLKRESLSKVPFRGYLFAAFGAFCLGSLTAPYNFIEHLSYLVSCLSMALWCHKLLKAGG